MRVRFMAAVLLVLVVAAGWRQGYGQQDEGGQVKMAKADFRPLVGGCGGVYFLAQPGELVVEVGKRDRNARNTIAELRAILVGPDREVLAEEFIPDDGAPVGSGLGPLQTATLRAHIASAGICALNITVSQDRYGQNMVWGFRTNCPKYLIETARGHKDERHQEPIVLESPEVPGVVCFYPRRGELTMELSDLVAAPTVHNGRGEQLAALSVEDGKASWTAAADLHRDAVPWQIRLPAMKGVLNVDGLTRWENTDPVPDACYWTPDPDSWFAFIENRWLLTPYQRHVYGAPGVARELTLQVHNNSPIERQYRLGVEFPGLPWSVQVPESVTVPARRGAPVSVRFSIPEGDGPHRCRIRATPVDTPEVSTWSSLIVRPGEAPAARLLDMPVQLLPYRHENEQFGYLADYPTEYQVYFDPQNRPYMRTGNGLTTWRDDAWVRTEINEAINTRPPAFEGQSVRLTSSKIVFDAEGDIYLPASCAGKNALLHSADGGRSFAVYEVPGMRGTVDIEEFNGHNMPSGPPPFVRFRLTAKDPNLIWRSLNDLELFVPRKENGRLEIGEPVLITRDCIGLAAHSGIPSTLVSRGSKVHVVWGEATDPAQQVPGVPTYAVTYDRQSGQLGQRALLGYGPPPNDVHNSPSITMDREGYLHALIGTHGRPFQYCRSTVPNDAGQGWSEPLSAGENLSMTYIGMVCADDGTINVVFRLWRGGPPYPNSSHATLAIQRKRPGQPWDPPRVLVVAPFSEYSIYYHRLTIDRRGRLFISYDYWSTHWFYRNDHLGNRRALLMSPDGGESWKLAATGDLIAGL